MSDATSIEPNVCRKLVSLEMQYRFKNNPGDIAAELAQKQIANPLP